jgi:hypothetical protein
MLQCQGCINTIEQDEFAQVNLVKHLIQSLEDRRLIIHSVKNFLRISKGYGFKEIIYKGSKGPYEPNYSAYELCNDVTYSEKSLKCLRKILLNFSDPVTTSFMNSILNSLNDVTSEFFLVIKEEIKSDNSNQLHLSHNLERRVRFYFDLIVDLCRIMEVVSRWVPEIFLDKELIHSNRMIEFMFFVLKQIFKMNFEKKLTAFCKITPSRTRNLAQMLTPFIGILTNLHREIRQSTNTRHDSLRDFVKRSDSFDI